MLTVEALKAQKEASENTAQRRLAKRDNLYYNFRYRRDSYKARKAMIYPFLMVAKRGASELRLYDDGSHQPTKNQELAMTAKCKGWRQKERELKRLAKLEAKQKKIFQSNLATHYWNEPSKQKSTLTTE